MPNKDPRIISLRAVRKASHLSGKVAKKGGHVLERVERKTTRMIINRTGSDSGHRDVELDEFIYREFPYMTPIHPALPTVGQKPSVTVFAFLDPKGFYGGIATLLLVAAELANKLGYDLRVAQTTGYSDKTDVLQFLQSNGIEVPASRFSTIDLSKRNLHNFGYLPLHPDDILVVSAWWDAYVASQLPLRKKFIYLIQDYEPIFYNNGDLQQFAESTYWSEKFIPLCNTELLYTFFKTEGYDYIADKAVWFEPAVGKVQNASKVDQDATRLFLYGRPVVHRNLFYTAIQAIDEALASNELSGRKWEVYCAGQNDIPSIRFKNGVIMRNLGKMKMDQYESFAGTVDLAVSPMLAPHPNYPTLELASLGAAVVTTKYKTKQSLNNYSKNIFMADPTVKGLAEMIIAAATLPVKKREANLVSNNIGTDWRAALNQPLDDLAKFLRKNNG